MMRFGINYVPSKRWFYSWSDYVRADVEADFRSIADLGCDHIRLPLRWDLFQPNAGYVSDSCLRRLVDTLDAARAAGLQVELCVLTGWMSGFWFVPSFVAGRNVITDPAVVDAEMSLLNALADAVGRHPALMGVDLGNEIDMFGVKRPFSTQEGDAWLEKLLGVCQIRFDGVHVLGVDHQPWFRDAFFSRKSLCKTGGMTSLHTWAKFTGALEYGVDSEECLCLAECNVELANAYADDPHRKVWVQEIGVNREWVRPERQARFVRQSLLNLARSENVWGVTWWCSHDIDTEYREFEPCEYDCGVFDVRNRPKPIAEVLRDVVRELQSGRSAEKLETGTAIVVDEAAPYDGMQYLRAFADGVRRGEHRRFVLSSRIDDADYLTSRKIDKLIRLA